MFSQERFAQVIAEIEVKYADPAYEVTLPGLSADLGISRSVCAAAAASLVNRGVLAWREDGYLVRTETLRGRPTRRTA